MINQETINSVKVEDTPTKREQSSINVVEVLHRIVTEDAIGVVIVAPHPLPVVEGPAQSMV